MDYANLAHHEGLAVNIRMSGCWLTHVFHYLRILEDSIMGVQCPPAAGANFSKCTPHHSSSVAATELEISKVGKSKESFARLSHPTRTAPARAPGQKGQGSGNRPLHKSSGGRGHSSQSVSHTVSEKAKSTSFKTDEVGHDDGQSRQSVSSKVGRRNR